MASDTLLLAGRLIEEMADPGAGFRDRWRAQARPEQIPPAGRYRVWYLAGGRGGGKTWTGAHTLAEWILTDPEPGEWGIVAPIYADAWSVCIEGESGFLAALGTTAEEVKRGKSKLVEYWHRSFAELKLRSGHIVRVASAEDGGLRIQGKNLKGAWCVARGEPVITAGGPVPVESVRPGMRVWTRQGWKRVSAVRLTRRDAELVRVVAAGGASVRVTPDHRIWTQHAGWMEARSLRYGDILGVWSSPPALPPGLNGKTAAGTAAARAATTPTGLACSCTSQSGSASIAGAFLTSTLSTTTTTTRPTTILPTCGCSPSASTCATTTWTNRADSGHRRLLSGLPPCANPGSTGLSASTSASGAVQRTRPRGSGPCTAPPSARWTPSRHAALSGEPLPFPPGPASGAARPSPRATPAPCTAAPAAVTLPLEPRRRPATGTASATPSAWSAETASRPRMAASCSAPVPAVSGTGVLRIEPAGRADVFDLQVDDAHEFVAGGILVHNCDEIGLWESWKTTWDESLKYAVRKGRSQIVATGTPKKSRKARELIRRLLADPAVQKSRLRTADNVANLSQEFFDEVVGAARGTRLEQQELEGVLLDDVEGALWTADLIDSYRADSPPELIRVVVAVDPAVSNEEDSDETGIVVVGEAEGGHGFVLADYSMRGTPDACMRKAVRAYHEFSADKIIGEANNGGDYIGSLLATVDPNVPYEKVIASRGKRVRAEPVSALYEQGRVHHVGAHTMLEEQMVNWVPSDPGDSPDRVDALVWGCAALRGLSSGSWLQAYGVKRCETCAKAFPEREGECPACHPPGPGAQPARIMVHTPPEPQAIGGWASAYGDFVRCPQCSRPYDTRRSPRCPHCAGGPLEYLRQHGRPAGISGMTMPGISR